MKFTTLLDYKIIVSKQIQLISPYTTTITIAIYIILSYYCVTTKLAQTIHEAACELVHKQWLKELCRSRKSKHQSSSVAKMSEDLNHAVTSTTGHWPLGGEIIITPHSNWSVTKQPPTFMLGHIKGHSLHSSI